MTTYWEQTQGHTKQGPAAKLQVRRTRCDEESPHIEITFSEYQEDGKLFLSRIFKLSDEDCKMLERMMER